MAIDQTKKDELWSQYQTNLSQAQKEATIARRQADEAAFLRQRQLNQALGGRGLQYSGLQQLGTAQNQAALSQQLNEQALKSTQTQAGLYEQYQQNVTAAEDKQINLYNQLTQQGLASGLTGTELTDYVSKLAAAYGTTLSPEQTTALGATGEVAAPKPFILTGDIELAAKEAEPEKTLSVNAYGKLQGYVTLDGERINVNGYDEAASIYKDYLSKKGMPMDKIEVIASKSFGSYSIDFKFKYNGKTYNRIIDALRDLEKNTSSAE